MQVQPYLLNPGEPFDIFFFVRNHTDTATYYVQAKVWDVRTGTLIQTENLTQSAVNSRLYIKTIQSPPDPAGMGRNIVAIATVYTDSGYTTKSTDYEEQEQYYLVKATLPFVGGGGGTDPRTVRDIVSDELEKALKRLPAPREIPEPKEVPFDALFGAIGALTREIGRIPKDAPSLEPLREQLANIQTLVSELPEPEKTEIEPILTALGDLDARITDVETMMGYEIDRLGSRLQGDIGVKIGEASKALEASLTETIQSQEFQFPTSPVVTKGRKEPSQNSGPIDISHLIGTTL